MFTPIYAAEHVHYVITIIIIVLISIDVGPILIFPIPCVHVATASDFVDSEVGAVIDHVVILPCISLFVNLLVYVAIGVNIGVIPINFYQNKLKSCLSPRLSSLAFH